LTVSGRGTETIHVKIYDGSDALVYNEDETVTNDFARIYNLKNLEGKITFEVTGESGESKVVKY
jgi:hypothetical protein